MAISLENFRVNRIISHVIFKREIDGPVHPQLNDSLSLLDIDAMRELQKRIVQALGSNSHAVDMVITENGDGSVFRFAKEIMDGNSSNGEFIRISKCITEKLAHSQYTRNIPGGAVVIFDGTTGARSRRYIGIIKADKHTGFTSTLEFLKDLILSPHQKLYKVALLVDCMNCEAGTHERTSEDFEVVVYDSNNDKVNANAAAGYFYSAFMGCAYPRTAPVLTRDFFNHTQSFLRDNYEGEALYDARGALFTYLKVEQAPIISVDDFATRYLQTPEERQSYSDYMRSKNVPMNGIPKDIDMIKKNIRSRRLKFTNNVSVQAPSDEFNNNVKIVEATEEHTVLEIMGKIADDA